METINILSENENYTAVNIGSMNELMKHTLVHSVSGRIVEGKVFYILFRLKDTISLHTFVKVTYPRVMVHE